MLDHDDSFFRILYNKINYVLHVRPFILDNAVYEIVVFHMLKNEATLMKEGITFFVTI